jgi:hypothetical protein
MKRMLRNAIELVRYGTGRLSLEDIYGVIQSAPNSLSQRDSDEWSNNSFCFHCIAAGEERERRPVNKETLNWRAVLAFPVSYAGGQNSIHRCGEFYWDGRFVPSRCSERPVLFRNQPCSGTDHEGVVIVLDLPVKEYGEVGRFAQVLFKLIWQKAVERRIESPSLRPVFLWADEAHNFIVSQDMSFQTTARSGRACSVYLTQIFQIIMRRWTAKGKGRDRLLAGVPANQDFSPEQSSETNYWAQRLSPKLQSTDTVMEVARTIRICLGQAGTNRVP